MYITNINNKLLIILIMFLLGFSSFGFSFPEENKSEKSEIMQNDENYRIYIITAKSLKSAKIIDKSLYIERQNNEWIVQIGGIQTAEEAQSIKNKLMIIGIINSSIIKIKKDSEEMTSRYTSSFDNILSSNTKVDLQIT